MGVAYKALLCLESPYEGPDFRRRLAKGHKIAVSFLPIRKIFFKCNALRESSMCHLRIFMSMESLLSEVVHKWSFTIGLFRMYRTH